MAFVAKVLYFVVERAAEPVSQRLERYAARNETFTNFCRRVAQFQFDLEHSKTLRRIALERPFEQGIGSEIQDDEISQLPDAPRAERATQLGCELLGEAFVWSVGLLLLAHQVSTDRKAEMENEQRVLKNEARILALEESNALLKARLASLEVHVPPQVQPCDHPRVGKNAAPRRWWKLSWWHSRPD